MPRILVVDDHAVVRRGLKQILLEHFNPADVTEARNGREALELTRKQNWDVVILDIAMPDKSGLDVLKEMKHKKEGPPVLVLSVYPEDQFAVRMLKAGAAGYLAKETAPDELVKAVEKALKGGKYISPSLAEKLAEELERGSEMQPHESLSDREYQVMCLIASGKGITEIGDKLSLSAKTISTYRARILEKMRMKTNAELVGYAIRNKIVE